MKNVLKKALSVMLVAVIMLTAAPLSGFVGLELPEWVYFSIMSSASGTYGDNHTWTLDVETGILTLKSDYLEEFFPSEEDSPWYEYRDYIKEVIICDGVGAINSYAFYNCKNLTSVTISDSVESIGYGAFYGCKKLEKLTIPSGVTAIGERAFQDCSGLTSVSISNTVQTIEYGAFSDCTKLESITVDSNNQYYSSDKNGVLFNKNKTKLIQYPLGNKAQEYTIPESVNIIGEWSFSYCSNIKKVTIPDNVTAIEIGVFCSCINLESVIIGSGVKSADSEVFYCCDSLTDIYYNGTEEEWEQICILSSCDGFAATIHYMSSGDEPTYDFDYDVGDIIEFGSYPQSKVTDAVLINTLNSKSKTWKSYGYYTGTGERWDGKMQPSDFMKYADVTHSGIKYRAVKFTKYRPRVVGYESEDNPSQEENGYYVNTTYWFKYEPLEWRVLDPDEGFVMCESLIDSQPYNNTLYYYDGRYYKDKNCENYASDYVTSSIRNWLNEDFYNIAFTETEKKLIEYSVQDNSNPIGTSYDSDTTNDKIFLMSFDEVINKDYGFSDSAYYGDIKAREGKGTDYAKSQGLWVEDEASMWLLRTPYNSSDASYFVNIRGTSYEGYDVDYTYLGIRPAMKIDVQSEIPDTPENPGDGSDSVTPFIGIFTTERSMTIEKGKTLELGFAIINSGAMETSWEKMAITVSDPSIVSVGDYAKGTYGYVIDFTGLKEGSTNVTVTDTDTGLHTDFVITVKTRYVGNYTYKIDDMVEFYPQDGINNNVLTNFEVNDMYVNNYKCKKSGKNFEVSFDVYNHNYFMGAVDVFDEKGEWVNSYKIDKFEEPESAYDAGEKIYYSLYSLVDGTWLTYQTPIYSEHTEVKITVPDGGYFTVSNNIAESPGTLMFNGIEFLLSTGVAVSKKVFEDFIETETAKKDFENKLFKSIIENEKTRKDFFEIFSSTAFSTKLGKYKENVSLLNYYDAANNLASLFEALLNSIYIDWKDVFKFSFDLYENTVQEFSGQAGNLLEAYCKGAEALNIYRKIKGICDSVDMPYAKVKTKIDDGYVMDNGVFVNTNGNVDTETVLQVFKVCGDDYSEDVAQYENSQLYNISFVKNDKTVQPTGLVEVRIPIPKGMKGNTCIIYRQEEDGSWTQLKAWKDGNYLVFETDHFSMYMISGDMYELTVDTLPDRLVFTQGESIDLTGLVLELNGELINEGFFATPSVMEEVGTQKVEIHYGSQTVEIEVKIEPIEEANVTFYIREPSITEIRYMDGIVLHPVIEGNVPTGSYIVWERSNTNFIIEEDDDEMNYYVIAGDKGYTTFTAILYNANGVEIASDSVVLYSNSGFFQKIGGFFRLLFGTTKTYDKY